jgi:hypothetical protein
VKAERAFVTSLPRNTAREILSVPWSDTEPVSSEATVYAGLQSNTPAPAGVVAVRLVAGAMGFRAPIATVGIPPGFSGLAIVASGIVADAWHVEAWGGGTDAQLNCALAIRQCCSGLNVELPTMLQHDVPPLAGQTRSSVHSLIRNRGAWRLVAGTGDATETLECCDRVLRLEVHASNQDATVEGLPEGTWTIQAGETGELWPDGNLGGPLTLEFEDTDHYAIEIVR